MDLLTKARVEDVAAIVRYWAEDRADMGKEDDLTGWCAKASAKLFKQLQQQGIAAEIHVWVHAASPESHVYLVVDSHVVDVTATQFRQFRNTPVLIMHEREAQAYEFYHTTLVFHSVEALRKWQKKERWPFDQIALPH